MKEEEIDLQKLADILNSHLQRIQNLEKQIASLQYGTKEKDSTQGSMTI